MVIWADLVPGLMLLCTEIKIYLGIFKIQSKMQRGEKKNQTYLGLNLERYICKKVRGMWGVGGWFGEG